MTDTQRLLAEYVTKGSEQAFRELVTRYLDLVYSTALRLTGGDVQLAEDAAQTVFVDLARKASTLSKAVMLGGWLHRDTCFVASKLMRGERRRQFRERQAVEMNAQEDHSETNLAQLKPLLDEAINQLREKDRAAILLRFYEQRDLRSIGGALGASENAVQKRVSRAVEELRLLLKKRGVALSVTTLGTVLGSEAISAAPAGLAVSISTAALSIPTAAPATLTLIKVLTMTKAKVGILSACIVASLGTSLLLQRQVRLHEQELVLEKQGTQLAQLQTENSDLAQLASLPAVSGNDRQALARLRQEVAALRSQTNALASLQQEHRELQQNQKSPLQVLEEKKEKGIFLLNYTKAWLLAFREFAETHQGQFPTTFDEALPFLSESTKAETNVSIGEFDIVYHGSQSALTNPANVMVIRQKQAWSPGTQIWSRAYAFADGHSEVHLIRGVTTAAEAANADLNFDSWEKAHMAPQPDAR